MPVDTLPYQLHTSLRTRPWYTFGFLALAVGLVVRLLWYPAITSDYTYFIRAWFDELASHPWLGAFAQPFADYAPLYLYLLKFLTFIPVSSLYSAKTLSLLFDVLIAYLGYRMLKAASPWSARKDVLFGAAVLLFSLPTVAMNSSLWAQSDAIYAAGVLASLYGMFIGAPLLAAISFGLAVSVKVQAIFFAPIFIGFFLHAKELWKYLLVPPLVFFISVLPTLASGNFGYWLTIYGTQAGKYPYLSVSAQSIYAYLEPLGLGTNLSGGAFWAGMLAAGIVALFLIVTTWKKVWNARTLVLVSLASTLLLPYLLPRMHERYFYLADLFAVLYAFYVPNRSIVPIIVVGTSLLSYMPFLSGQIEFLSHFEVDLRAPATLLLIPIGIVVYDLWRLWNPLSPRALGTKTSRIS